MAKLKDVLIYGFIICCICILAIGGYYYLKKGSNSTDELKTANSTPNSKTDHSEEEYVWIGTMIGHPMYINNDQEALKQFGKDNGVKVTIAGPREYDIPGQTVAIEEAIARNPAGIMILGMERGLIPAVNKAVEAGIPTIMVDADLIESKRIAFVGSNWYNIGVKQAEAMVKLIGGKGKVAATGIGQADNMEQGYEGFKSVIKNYPDIVYLGEFDDMCNEEEAQRITEELLNTYPDIAGIAGFDVSSGPGIGQAIKQADMIGKVKVTCVDIEPAHLKLCKEGVIQKLVGQKRKLFTYYGARLLYDYNHATISFYKDMKKSQITPIPYIIDTGLIEIDQTNVESFLQEAQ